MDNNYEQLIPLKGFATAEEIFKAADSIGDVKTPEGQKRYIIFLGRASLLDSDCSYSFKKTLESGLDIRATGYFTGVVRETLNDAHKKFLQTEDVPNAEYYFDENHGLREGFGTAENLVGNGILNLFSCLHYGIFQLKKQLQEYGFRIEGYQTEEEIVRLEQSCLEYMKNKESTENIDSQHTL